MIELPSDIDAKDDTGMPRRVKTFAIVAAILALAFDFLHLVGRGLGGHSF
jgi:hypothetical protein